MKQLIQTFLIDMRMSLKSFLGGYMVLIPAIILIVLRTFIPSVESTSANIAVVTDGPHAVEQGLLDALTEFANVVQYDTIEQMEQRLRGTGSFEGLYWDPDAEQYVSVVERTRESNTVFSTGAQVVRRYTYNQMNPGGPRITNFTHRVPDELADRTKASPVATIGGSIFLSFMGFIFGFLIGLNLVTDKEEGTDNAIKISPVSKSDYFVGKSIFPFLLIMVYTIIGLVALRLTHVNILQTYVVAVAAFSVALLVGLLLGALGKNENEAIGIGKMLGMIVGLSVLGGTLLPDGWQWVVYWSPIYWTFNTFESIFSETATWALVGWRSALIVGIVLVYFVLLRKRIIRGLS